MALNVLLDVEKGELYNVSPELGDRWSTKISLA